MALDSHSCRLCPVTGTSDQSRTKGRRGRRWIGPQTRARNARSTKESHCSFKCLRRRRLCGVRHRVHDSGRAKEEESQLRGADGIDPEGTGRQGEVREPQGEEEEGFAEQFDEPREEAE